MKLNSDAMRRARANILPRVLMVSIAAWSGAAFSGAKDIATATVAPAFTWVVIGDEGRATARAITTAASCPALNIDGRIRSMKIRAEPGTVPLRTTRSEPVDSKPSAFPVLACELALPRHAQRVAIGQEVLPRPSRNPRRIVVMGDTGCRLKKADNAFQACNDSQAYPFAAIARMAAAWKPDLVVHVGDYHYRENACPTGMPGCAGSSWGYGYDAWRDDFFVPAQPLLKAAAWVMTRGNHESCERAGQGWWRFLDPRPLIAGRDCNDPAFDSVGDYSDAYGVPLGDDAQLIVWDSSNTALRPLKPEDMAYKRFLQSYSQIEDIARRARHNVAANHHPVLGFAGNRKDRSQPLPGNRGIQSAFGARSARYFPAQVELLLSGHTHIWEQVSFKTEHPSQFISGISGTLEDTEPLPDRVPEGVTPASGAIVESMSSWVGQYGFMTMERTGIDQWRVQVMDQAGQVVKNCRTRGRRSDCR